MATYTLKRTNAQMPAIGLGLWKIPNAICAEFVYNAIKSGYRLFDSAADYGNEKEVGDGLRRALADGIVKREELWITSKLWNTFHARHDAIEVAKKQLADLGLDYFDLYLVHFPIALKHVPIAHRYPPAWWGDDGQSVTLQNTPLIETWKTMEELVDMGLAKNIGICNAQGSLLVDIQTYAKYEPQVLQVEIHPYNTQQALVNLAKTLGIVVTAYSSFGPQGYYEIEMGKATPSLMHHSVITTIAEEKGTSPAGILLAWALHQGLAIIPKTTVQAQLLQNLTVSEVKLTREEFAQISGLNRNLRFNDPADIDPRLAIFS